VIDLTSGNPSQLLLAHGNVNEQTTRYRCFILRFGKSSLREGDVSARVDFAFGCSVQSLSHFTPLRIHYLGAAGTASHAEARNGRRSIRTHQLQVLAHVHLPLQTGVTSSLTLFFILCPLRQTPSTVIQIQLRHFQEKRNLKLRVISALQQFTFHPCHSRVLGHHIPIRLKGLARYAIRPRATQGSTGSDRVAPPQLCHWTRFSAGLHALEPYSNGTPVKIKNGARLDPSHHLLFAIHLPLPTSKHCKTYGAAIFNELPRRCGPSGTRGSSFRADEGLQGR
jgi:hypothetical protein